MRAEERVLLVCMPFGQVFSPSIGLSLLKAGLAGHGMPARIRYFSIRFAEMIGQAFYYGLSAESRPSVEDLAGEWIFSRALFGSDAGSGDYVEEILRRRVCGTNNEPTRPASPAFIAHLRRARELADGFLEWCRQEIVRSRPKLVGFTSVFQQHVASLALARLVKQSLPDTFIVFGGANCEGVMGGETVRQFPFVDAAVSGEADLVFPELVRRVLERRPVSGLPGVRTRDDIEAEFARGHFRPSPMVPNLDALPYPDYGDYFEQFQASRFDREWQPSISFETSRGCWWGERMHCTFCGLNGQTMVFRSKSARRSMEELTWLTERHPGCDVEVTDNILDMRYFNDFLPGLAAHPPRAPLFYEVKSNLKKSQLRALRSAGVRTIQPGVESLSDPVLKLMRKGVSGLQNIQLLKWCKELGIEPSWNMLWGFPGEPPEEYERMAGLVPLLVHLPPPCSYGMIRLDRFSPNYDDAERLGFADVTPVPAYRYVYPLSRDAVANLAYFFSFRHREPADVQAYVARLARQLQRWRSRAPQYDLFSVDTGECLLVWDLRPVSRAPLTVIRGADRILYQACDAACDLARLGRCLEDRAEGPLAAEAIQERLEPLVEAGLLLREGPRYLALAVALGEYSPGPPAVERFHHLVQAFGRRVDGGWVIPRDSAGRAHHRGRAFPSPRSPSRSRARHRRQDRLAASQFSIDDRGDVMIRRIDNRTHERRAHGRQEESS